MIFNIAPDVDTLAYQNNNGIESSLYTWSVFEKKVNEKSIYFCINESNMLLVLVDKNNINENNSFRTEFLKQLKKTLLVCGVSKIYVDVYIEQLKIDEGGTQGRKTEVRQTIVDFVDECYHLVQKFGLQLKALSYQMKIKDSLIDLASMCNYTGSVVGIKNFKEDMYQELPQKFDKPLDINDHMNELYSEIDNLRSLDHDTHMRAVTKINVVNSRILRKFRKKLKSLKVNAEVSSLMEFIVKTYLDEFLLNELNATVVTELGYISDFMIAYSERVEGFNEDVADIIAMTFDIIYSDILVKEKVISESTAQLVSSVNYDACEYVKLQFRDLQD